MCLKQENGSYICSFGNFGYVDLTATNFIIKSFLHNQTPFTCFNFTGQHNLLLWIFQLISPYLGSCLALNTPLSVMLTCSRSFPPRWRCGGQVRRTRGWRATWCCLTWSRFLGGTMDSCPLRILTSGRPCRPLSFMTRCVLVIFIVFSSSSALPAMLNLHSGE